MADRKELEDAFEEGRRVGRNEAFGPRGLPRKPPLLGAEFVFRTSYFESYLQYERDILANLRHLQRLRVGRKDVELSGQERLEREVREELRRAREAVDAERRAGCGNEAVVRALRASPHPPASVLEYRDAYEFASEKPQRSIGKISGDVELGGADYGLYWQLEHPFKRWLRTRWRISWLCLDDFNWMPDEVDAERGNATGEVYALEFLDGKSRQDPPRVWLLGTLRRRASVEKALTGPILEAAREPNSLIVAAEEIARAAQEEEGEGN
jgi:hypothetical protein